MSKYRTSPDPKLTGMPPGIPFIIGNEAAERFSFYGMKTILAVFMTKYLWLMNDTPGQAMGEAYVTEKVHLFTFAVYITPLLGAFISDYIFGKYKLKQDHISSHSLHLERTTQKALQAEAICPAPSAP